MSTPAYEKDVASGRDVLPASAIDIRNAGQIAAIRARLLAWSECDAPRFAAQSREFMRACGVPAGEPGDKDATTVKSFINGVALYSLPHTTLSEFDLIHGKAKRSAVLWNAMPLAGRRSFFRILSEEVGPKYKAAIDLAITLEVGKAGSEFEKTTRWDEWAASPEVERYLSGIFVQDDLGRKYFLNQLEHLPDNARHIYFYQGSKPQGLGVCGSTNGFNYPAALAVPDIVASRIGGNAFIGKVPSKCPAFLHIRKLAESEALDVMAERFESYSWAKAAKALGVDLGQGKTVSRLKNSFGIISGREVLEPWAKGCATLRVVGGKEAGEVFRKLRADVDPSMEHTVLELAGNNPVVVMASAANLEGGIPAVVAELAAGNKSNSGQRCTSPRRWLIQREVYAEVRRLAIESYRRTARNGDGAIGNPLDPAIKIGAMDKGGYDAAMAYFAAARAAGAEVIGGERLFAERFPDARYLSPALVLWDGVDQSAKQLMHAGEVFAPIANLDMFETLDEAIAKTNRSSERLSGGFYCDSAHIDDLCRYTMAADLGSLIHNGPPKDLSPDGVHAGRQDGGSGITGSLKSLDQYTRPESRNSIRLLALVSDPDAAKKLAESLLAQ